ncbi:MAG: Alpha/Beta hydrolase protein [Benniella sp.]|nr:MAG: Alpha/Beta hydrolase protein [Benniella sp.]
MLMSTTSFLASQVRSSLSATVHTASTLVTSIKSSLGLVQDPSSFASKSSSVHRQEVVEEVEGHNSPSQHDQYPLLQPWKGFQRRIKSYAHSTTLPVTSCYSAPRYPIVLCHGLFGFDKMGPDSIPHLQIHYWSGIQQALNKLGAKVIVAKVPRTGSIKERAEDLHKILSATMEGSPVNFVAHSMGGLDCRYLISHIHDRNYDVQSLTTLATPHRGSPVMDWFRDNVGVGHMLRSEEEAMRKLGEARLPRATVSETAEAFNTILRDSTGRIPPPSVDEAATHPGYVNALLNRLIPYFDTPAYANLTTTYCNQVFNPNTPDDPRVAYFSYGGAVPQIPLWAPLGLPWEVIHATEGDNDGLVSTKSARWGHYVETVEADHWDMNNRWRLKIGYDQRPFDAIELYMSLATRLYNHGF